MTEQTKKEQQAELQNRRSSAVRTAWVLAAIALMIFLAFVLSGVLGQAPAS